MPRTGPPRRSSTSRLLSASLTSPALNTNWSSPPSNAPSRSTNPTPCLYSVSRRTGRSFVEAIRTPFGGIIPSAAHLIGGLDQIRGEFLLRGVGHIEWDKRGGRGRTADGGRQTKDEGRPTTDDRRPRPPGRGGGASGGGTASARVRDHRWSTRSSSAAGRGGVWPRARPFWMTRWRGFPALRLWIGHFPSGRSAMSKMPHLGGRGPGAGGAPPEKARALFGRIWPPIGHSRTPIAHRRARHQRARIGRVRPRDATGATGGGGWGDISSRRCAAMLLRPFC